MFEDLNLPDPITSSGDPRVKPRRAPGFVKKVKHVVKAVERVAGAVVNGQEIFTDSMELKRRGAICDACSYWNPSGNIGMGECSHSNCGCTKFKRGLLTEKCPLNKW